METPPLPILVFATHNAHKVAEVQALLGAAYEVKSLTDIGCNDDIVEDAATLEGNAQIKARFVVERFGFDCFADDTGLEVAALHGAPGVLSARYAGGARDPEANMDRVLAELANSTDRRAQFRTAICLIQGGKELLIEGTCSGQILAHRSGARGFGYDPIFQPDGHARSFAEMTTEEKNAISHRGQAVGKMVAHLRGGRE